MSQEKVEKRKAEKANRRQNSQSKRMKASLAGFITGVICLAIVVWIGYSIYSKNSASDDANVDRTPVNSQALMEYMYGGGATATEEEVVSEEAPAEEAAPEEAPAPEATEEAPAPAE